MQHDEERSACGNPGFERSLLGCDALSRWKGAPVAWIEASPHRVEADLVTERTGLVMIDTGATQADFLFGARTMSCEFTPGSIGLFAAGTELKLSRWRWARARRIYFDLDADLAPESGAAGPFGQTLRHTEIEFHDRELASVLRAIVAEIANGSPHGRLYAESLSLGVLMRLQHRSSTRQPGATERGKLTRAHLRRIEELVAAQLGRDIPLASLAATTGFSPSQFVRLFKNTLGCTPHQYVLRTRLERARELVLAGSLPLAVIASLTGFASQSHMTSAFVRAFEAPPGQMRRQARSGNIGGA